MAQSCIELERSTGWGFSPNRRLLNEIARLRGDCAERDDAISRYQVQLREGDHRIKNSLQIVASLMGMQERRESNPVAREALKAATARIMAVARIHDALQLNGGKDCVDVGDLIASMCLSLQAMAGDPKAVKIVVEAEAFEMPIAMAQPILLIANELVINALRHAFPNHARGEIRVTVARVDGELRVTVVDNGPGLPADYTKGRGYGMNLVRMMTAKVGVCFTLKTTAARPSHCRRRWPRSENLGQGRAGWRCRFGERISHASMRPCQ